MSSAMRVTLMFSVNVSRLSQTLPNEVTLLLILCFSLAILSKNQIKTRHFSTACLFQINYLSQFNVPTIEDEKNENENENYFAFVHENRNETENF